MARPIGTVGTETISGRIMAYIGQGGQSVRQLRHNFMVDHGLELSLNTLRVTLHRLRRAGMIRADREGKYAVYRLDSPPAPAPEVHRRPDEWS